jgi:choline transport protein
VPINIGALAFLAVALVFSFFPPINHPPVDAMNWSVVIWGGVLILSAIYYVFKARHIYAGPVEYVRKNT